MSSTGMNKMQFLPLRNLFACQTERIVSVCEESREEDVNLVWEDVVGPNDVSD